MKILISKLEEYITISESFEKALTESFERKKFEKGDLLLREGQHCKYLYFVESGMVRNFYNAEKQDVSTWFQIEGGFISSWFSFYSSKPSYESIEALEDTVMYVLHHDKYEELLKSFGEFEKFARILAQEQVALIDSFSKGYMFLSAKEKYELVLSYLPNIEQRVKLGQLATFLGISQETLSRIRAGK